jgi:Zn-dependent protease
MFLEPEQTGFDLRFRIGTIPVRIHPWFWLSAVILGWPIMQRDDPNAFFYLLLWVACVFVSILVHELGHVVMGRIFGSDGHIVLYSFGGVAIGSSSVPGRWQRIAVFLAGPGAGFAFLAAVIGAMVLYDAELILILLSRMVGILRFYEGTEPPPPWLVELLVNLIFINLFWGLVNLLPVWPLDGGQISRELCVHYLRNGLRISLIVSIAVAAGFAVNSLLGEMNLPTLPLVPKGGILGIIFFGLLAFGSWQVLQQTGSADRSYRDVDDRYERAPWERDGDWWKR